MQDTSTKLCFGSLNNKYLNICRQTVRIFLEETVPKYLAIL